VKLEQCSEEKVVMPIGIATFSFLHAPHGCGIRLQQGCRNASLTPAKPDIGRCAMLAELESSTTSGFGAQSGAAVPGAAGPGRID
jgi:hypothetical protein